MQSNNTGAVIRTNHEAQDRVMQVLPRELKDYLRYEAPWDHDVVSVFREWRRGVTVPTLLRALRGVQRKEARQLYGAEHPQASLV